MSGSLKNDFDSLEFEHIGDITNIMTLRQYAAIKLQVPDSGTDWLDEMIEKSLRNDLSSKAMQGIISASGKDNEVYYDTENLVRSAYEMADAMLQERNK